MKTTDTPIYGVQYSLTGGAGTPCIANGNSWEESRVTPKTNGELLAEIQEEKHAQAAKMAELDVIVDQYCSNLDKIINPFPENTPIKLVTNSRDFDYKWTGSKYRETSNLSTKELAKLVRDEINTKYPKKAGYRISTRYESFSGGSAIEISILATPFKGLTDEYKLALDTNDFSAFNQWEDGQRRGTPTRYTQEMCDFIKALEKIQNQYNFDDSESQTDYFHVNYYGSVEVSYEYHKLLSTNSVA